MLSKVIAILEDSILFSTGEKLFSVHEQNCCEHHYLSFKDLTIEDFNGLEFDLTGDLFFIPVEGYGIRLIPVNGFPVSIPGYGSNNGYYSTDLTLVLQKYGERATMFDISQCQEIG